VLNAVDDDRRKSVDLDCRFNWRFHETPLPSPSAISANSVCNAADRRFGYSQ
jgi:hypothetical protein